MTEGTSPLTISSATFANDRASFAFGLAQAGNVRISVYDGTGRAVAMSALAGKAGPNEATIGLPNLNRESISTDWRPQTRSTPAIRAGPLGIRRH